MKSILSVIVILFFSVALPAQEFILDNKSLVNHINKTIDLIYDFKFDEADLEIEYLEARLGNHPTPHLLRSMILYWRDRPFKEGTEAYRLYIYELESAISLAAPFQDDERLHEEGEFYIMAGYALLTDFYNETGSRMKAVGAAKKAYGSLKEGFKLKERFPDFYFSSGVYNYYREKYPELHPFYKTFLWLFVEGDTELGLEQLKVAADSGVFTRHEAVIYLFHLYLRYENKPLVALPYAEELYQKFDGNYHFKALYLEALIYAGDSIPEGITDQLNNHENLLYQVAGHLFAGLSAEQIGDISLALDNLGRAESIYNSMDRPYGHYLSLIYAGRARISIRENDQSKALEYYKLALKSGPYVPVMQEAEAYINASGDG